MSADTHQSYLERLLEKLCGNKPPTEDTQAPPKVVVTPNLTKPPLHALIIGINEYKTIGNLKAAAPDANEFKSYLIKYLRVPEEQITIILNKEATRANIISAFLNLAKDPKIEKGDPIVIYYAGHGSEVDPPPDRAVNGPKIQCIIPHDTEEITNVMVIPDFTVGALLTHLANEKGDNITVIFDCCHSAGGSRDDSGARYVDKEKLPRLPSKVDAKIIEAATGGTRGLFEPEGFLTAGMASHVMLAACAHGELAYEDQDGKRGFYTTALLKLLRSVKVDNLTYKGCMQRLPTLATKQPQNPVCEGKNIDRLFFNARVPGANNQFIAIKPDGFGNYDLQAGVAQGITVGCTFSIHNDHVIGPKNPTIGTMVVDIAEPFTSRLKVPEGGKPIDIDELAYGCQTGYGPDQELKLHITDAFANAAKPDDKWRAAFTGSSDNVVLRLTERDLAHFVVDVNAKGQATFTTTNSSALAHGIETLPATVEPTAEEVTPVLHAAARWSYHLRRMPGSRPFQKSVRMEFYKLTQAPPPDDYDEYGNPIYKPVGENLNVGGEADIVVNPQDLYGINITNTSGRDLYAYLFYFSIPDLSIIAKFNPTAGNDSVDPSLPRGVPLALGYGSSGLLPFAFKLVKTDLDCGIFKLFLTTEHTDFDSVKQPSPFGRSREMESDSRVRDLVSGKPVWDVITMTLVQRRYPKEPEKPKPVPVPEPVPEPVPVPEPAPEPVKPTEPSRLPDGIPVPYTSRSTGPASVKSINARDASTTWFRSPPLIQQALDSITNMRLRTLSKAQAPKDAGPSDNSTWFEIQIIGSDDMPKLNANDLPIAYKSHASPCGEDPSWIDGTIFERSHEIWTNVKPGEYFEVVVCSKGRGWSNDAQEGSFIFW